MVVDELLREFETLPYTARMRRMVELGRRAGQDKGVAALLDALAAGNVYRRSLALQSCFGSYDGAHVLAALQDPSRGLRAQALALVPLVCDDAQALAAFDGLVPVQQRSLARRLFKRRRQAVIDRFLDALARRDEVHLPTMLRFGSPSAAERHLDGLLDCMTNGEVRHCTRMHPRIMAAALARRAEAAEQLDRRLQWQVNAALPELAERDPDEALRLLRVMLRHVSLAQLDVQRLAERRPAEVADIVLERAGEAGIRFEQVAHRLDTTRLLALLEQRPHALRGQHPWLERLKPEQRAVVYDAYGRGWRDSRDCLSPEVIALLPRPARESEARRHLRLPALAARPAERIPYAQFLPWDEARDAVEPLLRDPDADLRAVALGTLAAATRFERGRLADLLAIMHARGNEQDPVRSVMLAGLAALPPSAWQVEHLDRLGQIIRQALDAADLSELTAAAVQRLLVSLLPFHPGWAAGQFAMVVRERGRVAFGGLEDRLSDDEARRLELILLPVLRSWEDRERERNILAVARSFGRRLEVMDQLVGLVERVIQTTRTDWVARDGLAILDLYRRDRLAPLVPALLGTASGWLAPITSRVPGLGGGDPSWIVEPVVYTYLHCHRQDLLTPFLGQSAFSGRWSTGKTRFVLPLYDGFHRWTDTQQAIFARTLVDLGGDDERDTPAVLGSIASLAALPAVPPDRLIGFARDRRPAVRDAALRALGRLDSGEGLPALLEALRDDRARIAIYALRGALLEMPAGAALALLRQAPLEQVTVAKEVVRLIGELRSREALEDLLHLDRRELHRDVRVALLRALWSHLDSDAAWAILLRAAASTDAVFARAVSRIPADRLSLPQQRRLVALLTTVLAHPEPSVRVDVLRRCSELPVSDPERVLLAPLLRALESAIADEYNAAAGAMFQTYTGRDASPVAEAVRSIRTNRRALRAVVQALRPAVRTSPEQLLPTARAVLDVLEEDPRTAQLQTELAMEGLPTDELAATLERLAASGRLYAEPLCTAIRALEQLGTRYSSVDLARLEQTLGASDEPALRRLALAALVGAARGSGGWSDERLRRLYALRQDAAPPVAAAAEFTFPPGEE